MVQEGKADTVLLEIFRSRIPEKARQALEPFGYYDAQVAAVVETEKGRQRFKVTVAPGEPVRISALEVGVTGPGKDDPVLREAAASFPLKVGEALSQPQYERGKEDLRTKALNLGYLGAEYTTHVIRLNRGERKAEIALTLETGKPYLLGEVSWEGAERYPRIFLRRYLDFQAGEPYSYAKIYQTQLNLINSDRFAAATVRADKEEAQDGRVPVHIRLEPSPSKRLRPGVGYATDTGARFALRYHDLNVLQSGHDFNVDMSLAERRRSLSTYYTLPGSGHVDNRTTLKAGLQQDLLKAYDSMLFTLEGEQAHSFGRGTVGSAFVQFRQENFSESGQAGHSTLLLPGLRFSQRRVDDVIRPRKGFRYYLEGRGSSQVLGAPTNFLQGLANADTLIPLTGRLSLIPRVQLGATWQADALTDLPPTLRFYAGGDRSVRGYTYQSLGPKDANGNVIGGRNLVFGSLEAEYAITKNWAAAAFYDVGNAYNNFEDLRLAQGAGVGVRYYTVAGPIRVDLARQINVDNPGFQLHVTMGFAL